MIKESSLGKSGCVRRCETGDNVHEHKELLLLRISEAKILTILFYESISHRSFSYEKLFAIKLLVLKQAS